MRDIDALAIPPGGLCGDSVFAHYSGIF